MAIRLAFINSISDQEYERFKDVFGFSSLVPNLPVNAKADVFTDRVRSFNQAMSYNYEGRFLNDFVEVNLSLLGAHAYEECLHSSERKQPGLHARVLELYDRGVVVEVNFVGFGETQAAQIVGLAMDFSTPLSHNLNLQSNTPSTLKTQRDSRQDQILTILYQLGNETKSMPPPAELTLKIPKDYISPPPAPKTLTVIKAGGGARDAYISEDEAKKKAKEMCDGTTRCDVTLNSQLFAGKPDLAPGQFKNWMVAFQCGLETADTGWLGEGQRIRVTCPDFKIVNITDQK
jgi:hypothetical protein